MPITLTDDNTVFPANVHTPGDGDEANAATFLPGMQDAANRTAYLKRAVDLLDPNFSGVRALRRVADITALKALAVPTDKTFCIVDGQGLYEFFSAAVDAEALPFIVSPNAGLGKWKTTAGILKTILAGAFQLAGGSSDWPTFSASRSRVLLVAGNECIGAGTAGTAGAAVTDFSPKHANMPNLAKGAFVTLQVTGASPTQIPYLLPLRELHNGATLASASLTFITNGTHSQLPNYFPGFGIYRSAKDLGTSDVSLRSGGIVSYTTASVPTYNASTPKAITFTPNQNNVIDTSQYVYYIIIWDEGNSQFGADTKTGTQYCSVELTFANIVDMRFP